MELSGKYSIVSMLIQRSCYRERQSVRKGTKKSESISSCDCRFTNISVFLYTLQPISTIPDSSFQAILHNLYFFLNFRFPGLPRETLLTQQECGDL